MRIRTIKKLVAMALSIVMLMGLTAICFAADDAGVTVGASDAQTEIIDLANGSIKIESCGADCKGHVIKCSTETTNNKITVNGGRHSITLEDVSINSGDCAVDITGADVTLTLAGENNLENTALHLYGGAEVTLKSNFTLSQNAAILIEKNSVLTTESNVNLTNNGTITVEGTFINNGTIENLGKIVVDAGLLDSTYGNVYNQDVGTIEKPNNGKVIPENLGGGSNDEPAKPAKPEVKLEVIGTPAYGKTIKLKVTVIRPPQPKAKLMKAMAFAAQPAADTVVFYCDDKEIGRETIVSDTAETKVTLRGKNFNAGKHIIKIDCVIGEGADAQRIIYEQQLTIQKGDTTAPSEALDSLTGVKGQFLSDVKLPARWRWKHPNTELIDVGENTYTAIYTPVDALNYNEVEVSLIVVVTEEAPEVPAIPETGVNLSLMLVLSALALIATAGISVKLLIKK